MRNFKKHIYNAALIVSLTIPSWAMAQAKLAEKVTKKGSEIVIPYEKYVLPNGLTVIIHEDRSDPLVHVDVTYHVGSSREQIGKSGFAHFFEHMMFQGSDNVADEQHFKIITEAGGTLNGTTNRDRTNYFETVPANQLEKMLWLEADRMGFLLDAVTQKKFEVQRATVKNERGQNYDNRPYGLVSEVLAKNLYPYGHPYSWLTIGYIEDLNRVDVNDLKNFFLRWYGPNNAVLTVGGDVNTKEVLTLVEKYFGSIPKGKDVAPIQLPLPVIEKDRYIAMVDNYAKLPMLRMAYVTTPSYSKDEPALDCLAEIIGQGKSSILYKNLVKTQKAVNASMYNYTSELSGEFTISVTPFAGISLAETESIIRQSFEEFEKRGVTDEDITKFRNAQEAQIINGLESVSGKVSRLAANFTFTGDANYIQKQLKDYTSVTKEDVMRVYNQYIKNKNAVIISVLPKDSDAKPAAADNHVISEKGYVAPDYGYNGLTYNKAKDNFDRSKMPGSGKAVVVTAPKYWQRTINNSFHVIGAETKEIPAVNILIKLKGGTFTDAFHANKAGIASLFAAMMEEDTKNYTAEAFSIALDKLGSSIDINAENDGISVSVRTLSKNMDATMQLLEERLLRPNFTEEAFSTNKKRLIENIKNSKTRAAAVASEIFPTLLYGKNNVLGWSSYGTEETVNNIQLADMEQYYATKFSRKDAEVVVVGDINEAATVKALSFLNKLPDNAVSLPALAKAPVIEKTKIYVVNIPKAAQTEFRIGYVTDLKYDALGEYFKTSVMNYPLGGAFNSRLNLHLREEKGWTYGARSYFAGDKYTGVYTFSAGIKASATDSALTDILGIISNYKTKGATPEELAFTKSSMTQSEARKYETGGQKAGFLNRIQSYKLNANYSEEQNKLLGRLSLQEINTLAGKNVPDASKMVILLVGDKSLFIEDLKKHNFEIVELDKSGNIL